MSITPVVKNLLIINIVIAVIDLFFPAVSFSDAFGLRHWASENFAPYQLFTHFFVHASLNINPAHLLFNMFALYMFGPMLEGVWGSKRFVVFYLVCGFGASILFSAINYVEMHLLSEKISTFLASTDPYVFEQIMRDTLSQRGYTQVLEFIEQFKENPTDAQIIKESKSILVELFNYRLDNSVMVGASGAISGIFIAFGMTFPNQRLLLLIPPIPMKAKYMVILFALFDMYRAWQNAPDDNVAHFAHLGGMLVAFILIKIWRSRRLVP